MNYEDLFMICQQFGIYTLWIFIGVFCAIRILFSVASAILSIKRQRNPYNWFFLTLFWGGFGVLYLACSKTLSKEKEELDRLSLGLWITVVVLIMAATITWAIAAH